MPEVAREKLAYAESLSGRRTRTIEINVPAKLKFLLEMHRYKVAYGGRGAGKSWTFADCLLFLGAHQKLRILCAREVQRSIRDSVHRLLCDRIELLGLGSFYQTLETEIRGRNGTEFLYSGLGAHTVESIKSFANIDICWVEEAQSVSETSWRILIPTIRAPNSEIWVSFNPDLEGDPVWKRFVVQTPTGIVRTKINFDDNAFFPKELENERLDCLKHTPEDYANVWLGEPRTTIAGAIYSREVLELIEQRRFMPIPYDPRLPVHTVWDLGWNDAMSIIMVQKPTPTTLNVINYMEDSFKRYDEYVADMRVLRYNWGYDWLPHDAANGNPQTGKSAAATLRGLGRRVKIIPRSDPEQRIKAGRMMFPRTYIDSTERARDTGYLGCGRLMDCLKRYRRNVPKSTDEPSTPVHDQYSHGADAFGGLAEIVDQIRNDGDIPEIRLPAFSNVDAAMGVLG